MVDFFHCFPSVSIQTSSPQVSTLNSTRNSYLSSRFNGCPVFEVPTRLIGEALRDNKLHFDLSCGEITPPRQHRNRPLPHVIQHDSEEKCAPTPEVSPHGCTANARRRLSLVEETTQGSKQNMTTRDHIQPTASPSHCHVMSKKNLNMLYHVPANCSPCCPSCCTAPSCKKCKASQIATTTRYHARADSRLYGWSLQTPKNAKCSHVLAISPENLGSPCAFSRPPRESVLYITNSHPVVQLAIGVQILCALFPRPPTLSRL